MMKGKLREALKLTNPRPEGSSRIAMVSLPVPLGSAVPSGIGNLPTQTQPVGWWPESVAGARDLVRRQLMFSISEEELQESFEISWDQRTPGVYEGPEIECEIICKKNTGVELTEVNEARITFGKKAIGLRLGLRHGGKHKWWEWVRVEELWSGPLCKVVRLAGFIEVEHFGDDYYRSIKNQTLAKNIHYQNWLRDEVFALMFSNGVVHITCRHINNHLFDHGRDLADVCPAIAFATPGSAEISEVWDGDSVRFRRRSAQPR